ncbi:MAG: anion permease [Clostridiales bacterium]|nr:anion permease [Clostridiales bacterium]
MTANSIKIPRLLIVIFISLGMALLTPPTGVSPEGWKTFAFFVGFILACLVSVGSIGELALILICGLLVSGAMPIENLLNGFANPAVWLVLLRPLALKIQIWGIGLLISLLPKPVIIRWPWSMPSAFVIA